MNIWKTFAITIVSPLRIAELLGDRKRKVFGYLALLMLVCLIPTFITTSLSINSAVVQFQTFMKSDEVPDFQLTEGILTSNIKEPLIGDLQGDTYIFDTTGTYDEAKVSEENATFALLADRMIINDGASKQTIPYSDLAGLEFSKSNLNDWIDLFANIKWLLFVIVIVVIYAFEYFTILLIGLILALVGLAFNASSNHKLPYGRIWVIGAYGMTIPTVVSWILKSFQVHLPFAGLLFFIACSVILYLVMREVARRTLSVEE
jgi:hypothetical protein